MQYLFSDWDKIASQIKSAKKVLLLFDYDGTLTPIAERPEIAVIPEESRQLLKALSHNGRFIVGVVSGRKLNNIQSKVGVEGIIYVGNHGFEIKGPGLAYSHIINSPETKSMMGNISSMLNNSLSAIKGAIVEDKGLTVSIHYRLVKSKEIDIVIDIIHRMVETGSLADKVKITYGKKVYEIRPNVHWHKGLAAKLIIERYGRGIRKKEFLPVYAGDDLTDEDAFKVIDDYDGVSVFIGKANASSAARYYLRTCKEVNKFMKELLKTKLDSEAQK
ncbi:MAG: trehalose-phosphatase [Nitrospirae bacterium]|nr:trehalose-phosphatase [Nitrospirota bacterium]